jgi:hypothetical protein
MCYENDMNSNLVHLDEVHDLVPLGQANSYTACLVRRIAPGLVKVDQFESLLS